MHVSEFMLYGNQRMGLCIQMRRYSFKYVEEKSIDINMKYKMYKEKEEMGLCLYIFICANWLSVDFALKCW